VICIHDGVASLSALCLSVFFPERVCVWVWRGVCGCLIIWCQWCVFTLEWICCLHCVSVCRKTSLPVGFGKGGCG